ncbi:hypothetical protein MES4922_210325 [Mesorhizobium ventifaucium]|uniref:Uncharacterized protein n=1 Tax=Mesorhizobium ventifaucium TaxID=666020 RepID=A0ABM9DSC7_9HYPH|nr:hypothetical protein MES4922_210325 [Mesorhizobium ventifaucium]
MPQNALTAAAFRYFAPNIAGIRRVARKRRFYRPVSFPTPTVLVLMTTQSVTFAPFEAHHLEEATALSRAAGWPHRKED